MDTARPEEPTPPDADPSPEAMTQVAVWYFIAATFVFAAPNIWFTDADAWLRLATIAVGMLLVVLGAIRLGRELAAHRRAKTPRMPDAGGHSE